MTDKVRGQDWGGILYFLALLFFIPIAIGKLVLGASWAALGSVYGLWFLILVFWGASNRRATLSEKIGWPIILAMFFTIPFVLVGLLLLREIAGIR